jgi:hypothetical protein
MNFKADEKPLVKLRLRIRDLYKIISSMKNEADQHPSARIGLKMRNLFETISKPKSLNHHVSEDKGQRWHMFKSWIAVMAGLLDECARATGLFELGDEDMEHRVDEGVCAYLHEHFGRLSEGLDEGEYLVDPCSQAFEANDRF